MKTNNTFLFVLLALLIGATAACSGGSVADTPAPPTDIPVSIDNTPPVTPTTEATLPAAVEATEPALAVELWPSDRFGYGIQSHAIIGDPAQAMMVVADQLRLDWVKVQLEWPLVEPIQGEYQWHYYDGVVEQAEAHGLRLLFSVVGAPQWSRTSAGENGPPDDFQLYSGFLADLMGRYEGQISALEIWNEQNLVREWTTGQSLSPGAYVALLSTAYQTVKSIDPNVIIISGALAPTGVTDWVTSVDDFEYLGQALDAGLLQYPRFYFDVPHSQQAEWAALVFRPGFEVGLAGAKTISGVSLHPAFQSIIDTGLPASAGRFEFLHHVLINAQGNLHLGTTSKRSAGAAHQGKLCAAHFVGIRVFGDASIDCGILFIGWKDEAHVLRELGHIQLPPLNLPCAS